MDKGDDAMPMTETSRAILAAALMLGPPAFATEPPKADTPPSGQDGGAPSPSDPSLPPAFHAPGPDVGMRNPPPGGRRSPEWFPPGDPRRPQDKQVSPN